MDVLNIEYPSTYNHTLQLMAGVVSNCRLSSIKYKPGLIAGYKPGLIAGFTVAQYVARYCQRCSNVAKVIECDSSNILTTCNSIVKVAVV